jgi:dTDP-L-rhamnose 4-epimerase
VSTSPTGLFWTAAKAVFIDYGPGMRVLVTGGAGFIGSHIATTFTDAGHDVVVLDALLPAAHNGAGPRDSALLNVDVRDGAAVERALGGIDVVCHQAAMVGLGTGFDDAPDYVACNDHGTAVLLSAMARRHIDRLVLASSMVVYGEGYYHCGQHGSVNPLPRREADLAAGQFEPRCPRCESALDHGLVGEETAVDPRNVYAATKVAQEHLSSAWSRVTGGRVAALRYHNVYGPGMPRDTPYAGVASFFRSALERGEAPRVFEDGAQRRDFVNVADVARANLAAAESLTGRPRGFWRAYNVASGEPHTIADLAGALTQAHGGSAPLITGEYRLGDVRHITASTARITAELDWKPQVGFGEGVAQFAGAALRG